MPDKTKPFCGFCGKVIDEHVAKYDQGNDVYLHDGPSINQLRISMGNGYSEQKVARLEASGEVKLCATRYVDRLTMEGAVVYLTTVELTDPQPEDLVGIV